MAGGQRIYDLVFWEDKNGKQPCLDWIKEDLSVSKRRALGTAMGEILEVHGIGVVGEKSWGRQVGQGLFEFRLDRTDPDTSEKMVLRVFCHAYGNKEILLLHGYDKGEHPSRRRQDREIAEARRRLTAWRTEQRTAKRAPAKRAKAGSRSKKKR